MVQISNEPIEKLYASRKSMILNRLDFDLKGRFYAVKSFAISSDYFWKRNPALLYAITIFISFHTFLYGETPYLLFLWLLYLLFLKRFEWLLIIPALFFYSTSLYEKEPVLGKVHGIFSISSLREHQSPFYKSYLYKGTLYTENQEKIPCTFQLPQRKKIAANTDYLVQGILDRRGPYDFTLKLKEGVTIPSSISLAEYRFHLKEQYHAFLESKFSKKVASFFFAITTGELNDRLMRFYFQRVGLEHILGVSGFHFTILLLVFSLGFSYFLPRVFKAIYLLVLITSYYFFVGDTPAVARCWMMAAFYLIARLFHQEIKGLNLLGIVMGVELLLHPMDCSNLGFVLSFTSCIGICLFYPFFEKKLSLFFPKRTRYELSFFSPSNKFVLLFVGLLRKSLSLTLAVNLCLLPILLYHFHTFLPLSLIYNLFFPFLADFFLFLFLIASLLYFLFPPLSHPLFCLIEKGTSSLLNLAAHPPLILDTPILIPYFPAFLIPLYFSLLFAVYLKYYKPDTYNESFS